MNQLIIEHKKTSKSEVESREVKGAALSQTRNVFFLMDSKDTYYVQSEHSNDIYYLVKYNPDFVEYCSCLDNSIRLEKCKHIFAIEKSIVKGTLKEIDKFNGKLLQIKFL